ncbi:toxin-antitoxin system YwqK family antitoxin [Pararhodonellum marinum]|uniref:toxin-antitoxin system YwqK family antitoxin n=1 Tax=Pararhodonellum marinum TaxID=2755358 RepID=UPI0018903B8C|nr:toxin-antitoxin system YwqK family antitoxin [Pararhodonellum marinum]
MRTMIFLGILLIYSNSIFGQVNIDDLERVNGLWCKKGDSLSYSGEFEERYENGVLKGTGNFVSGELDGLRVQYYPNGNKRTEKYYKNAYPHGFSKEYFENGNLKQEGEFEDNKEIGLWTIYHETGEKYVVLNFENGIQQGEYFEFDKNGGLLRQFFFNDGKAGYAPEFMELMNKASEMTGILAPSETIPLYDKAIELNPTVAQVYLNRGTAYSNGFEFEKAIMDFDKAIVLNPNYMEAYTNRGNAKINAYTSTGNLEPTPEQTASACEDFFKAIELGDKGIYTTDMIYLYCKKMKKNSRKKP